MTRERPTQKEAEDAVRVLLNYIGEDTQREGMRATPTRVIKSYTELFAGYKMDISEILSTTFSDISNFDDIVMLKNINFSSSCEHHMLPFSGFVDIAYLPNGSVVGISKIARLVDAYSKRLQIQEKMTANIAEALDKYLKPRGVAIRVSASHSCMTTRGTP
jgi:GTP cyclohydrolase I